jgi:DNA ligase-1
MISPMLAQKADAPLPGDEWISELKLDGIRLILSTHGERMAWTRHGTPCLSRFPELASAQVPLGTVLDGELVCLNESGKPCFESVLSRFSVKDERKIRTRMQTTPVEYVVFDVIQWKGKDVTDLPLLKRKALLEELTEQDHLSRVRYEIGQGRELFGLVQAENLEGIVQKRKASRYEIGKRSEAWRKVIHWHHHDVVLTGIRKEDGAWLIGVEEAGRLRPAGVIEFPPPTDVRKAVRSILPLAKTGEDAKAVYLHPEIRLTVKSRGWTKSGMIRLPVFQGFRWA